MESIVPKLLRDETCSGMEIEEQAYAMIDAHAHFAGRARRFEFRCCQDVLIIRGNVPSYYLKQVLQTVLRDVGGIRAVDNQVTVVSSECLSSRIRD